MAYEESRYERERTAGPSTTPSTPQCFVWFLEAYWEVVGVEGMFFEARAVANSTVLAGALRRVSGRLLP